jgi:flagellar biosynthesis protein FlhB
MNLQELRDLIIVICGSMSILVLFVTLVVVLVIGFAARGLISLMRSILQQQVSPTMDSAKQAVDSVRGTTAFITDTAVSPVIRLYGVFTGLRRGLMSLAGLTRRVRR